MDIAHNEYCLLHTAFLLGCSISLCIHTLLVETLHGLWATVWHGAAGTILGCLSNLVFCKDLSMSCHVRSVSTRHTNVTLCDPQSIKSHIGSAIGKFITLFIFTRFYKHQLQAHPYLNPRFANSRRRFGWFSFAPWHWELALPESQDLLSGLTGYSSDMRLGRNSRNPISVWGTNVVAVATQGSHLSGSCASKKSEMENVLNKYCASSSHILAYLNLKEEKWRTQISTNASQATANSIKFLQSGHQILCSLTYIRHLISRTKPRTWLLTSTTSASVLHWIRNDSTSPPRLEMWQWALHPPPVISNGTWTRLEHITHELRKPLKSVKVPKSQENIWKAQMEPCSLQLVTIQDEVHPSHHWGLLGKVLAGSWNVAKMWQLFGVGTCPKWSMHLNKAYLKGCALTSPMNHDGSK